MTPEQALNIVGVNLAPDVHQRLVDRITAIETAAWDAASAHINAAMDDVERYHPATHIPCLSIDDVRRLANELARIAQGLQP